MKELSIQNAARNALAGLCSLFRAQVGQGWTGEAVKLTNGDVLIKNARPFKTGLPPGFADTFGWKSITVTPDMVGQRIAVFTAIEFKTETGRVSPEQKKFIAAVQSAGGIAGVARSPEEAKQIVTTRQTGF